MSQNWTRLLGGALCVRLVLDWTPFAGLRSALSAVILLGVIVCLVQMRARLRNAPLLPWVIAFSFLVAANGLRATDDPVRWMALYIGPWLMLLAGSLAPSDAWWRWSRALMWLAIPAFVWALWGLAAGQPATFILNGYPRLLGAYANPHGHALMLVLWASVGVLWVDRRQGGEWLGAIVAFVAVVLLTFTWVRTAMLMLAIQGTVFFLLRGRRAPLIVGMVLLALTFGLSSGLQERFSDVFAVLSGQAPDAGWGAIGSHRVDIWREILTSFLALGWSAKLLGLGLGAHHGFHKALDPHSEVLALWIQLGVLGPVAWWGGLFRFAWQLRRRSEDPLRCFALSWLVSILITAPISNEVLNRVTFAWWIWATIGLALSSERSED